MKTKKLVALFLSVLMLLSSASALAADKEDVVYKEEDIARAKEYTDTPVSYTHLRAHET